MLKLVGLRLPFELVRVDSNPPPQVSLFDLPSYCYDMHTRVGLQMLRRIVAGTAKAEELAYFFRENPVKGAHRIVGEALFFEEGGRIQGELLYERLCSLEQRFFAHRSTLSLPKWLHLRGIVKQLLADGIINQIRQEVLERMYLVENGNRVHSQLSLEF